MTEMMEYHLIKSGSSPLGLMFDSISFRDYVEMDENVLTSDVLQMKKV